MKHLPIEPGIYLDVPEAVYHHNDTEEDFLSSSKVKKIMKCPAICRNYLDTENNPSDAMLMGTAVHAKVLQPTRFDELVAVAPFDATPRKKADKEDYEDFLALNQGKAILRPWTATHDLDSLDAMVENVNADPDAVRLLAGDKEVTVVWVENGVLCKARIDSLLVDNIVDLKTTRDAAPGVFRRQAHMLGYHIQGAFYRRGLRAVMGDEAPKRFSFVCVENSPPHLVQCFEIHDEELARADAIIDQAFERWAVCKETGEWPGYGGGVHLLQFTDWSHIEDEALADEDVDVDVDAF